MTEPARQSHRVMNTRPANRFWKQVQYLLLLDNTHMVPTEVVDTTPWLEYLQSEGREKYAALVTSSPAAAMLFLLVFLAVGK